MSEWEQRYLKTCAFCGDEFIASQFGPPPKYCSAAHQRAAWVKRLRDNPEMVLTPHGTRYRYAALGCRCDECRAAQTAYMVERHHRLNPDAEYQPWKVKGGHRP